MIETSPGPLIALDIGGANLKAAHASGAARSVPFALWKRPEDLADVLGRLVATLPPADRVALTTTAELCDCFETKAEGVRHVLRAAREVFAEIPVRVWGTDGRFHSVEDVLEVPWIAAAANWLALAHAAGRLVPEGPALLIDVGSTTTDLIPLRDGLPIPRGRTDTERLRSGELVYVGSRRTPVCSLATELRWRGGPIGLAAELFATTLDVYLTLGDLPEDPADVATADGRPATIEASRDRLARMVGADRQGFSADDAQDFATEADLAIVNRLVASARRACEGSELGQPRSVILAGAGEFLGRRVAERVMALDGEILSLADDWGPVASAAGCAWALLLLASEDQGEP